ncbi:MAG: threonine/serine exporter family protein [Rhizobiales bacterium]|nr:threonine/serine exporter family protein [Hyphomicrobiales bacterium]
MVAAGQAEAVALLTTSARLLFTNGQTSERTIDSVVRMGEAMGLKVSLALAWGECALRVQTPDGREDVHLVPAAPAGVDMNKVALTLDIMEEVCAGRRPPGDALAALEAVGRQPPASLPRFAFFAGAGAAALAVIFGAGDPASIAIVFASAAAGACLRRGLAHLFPNPLPQPLGAALLAGLVAAAAGRLLPSSAVFLIALCPCMVLVPGPHLLNSALDLARLRLPLGGARLGFASLVILLICVGLIAGLTAGGQNLPASGGGASVPLLFDVLAAGIAVSAYGTFFSMPWRMLPFPMAVGMAAHALHWAALSLGAGLAFAAFLACLVVGAVVTPVANRLRLPFAAAAFASVVSLIPGSFVFRMSADLVGITASGSGAPALLTAAVMNGATALTIMVAMAFGLILPKMLIENLSPPTYP